VEDVYQVVLTGWTTVTAVLMPAQPTTDLDLYCFPPGEETAAAPFSATHGSGPEILQLRLPPGANLIGVHHAGGPASRYTLRLLATPSPELEAPPQPALINYVLVGDVT